MDTDVALRHPLRAALLDLVTQLGTVTSTEAARRLGQTSGACSFHLRQLARYGYLEDVPGPGRTRPWRRRGQPATVQPATVQPATVQPATHPDGPLGPLVRELEDEGYRSWLARRERAPEQWRRDEASSAVLYLTPQQLPQIAAAVRAVVARYMRRPDHGGDVAPVAFVARLFPLLPPDAE